MHDKIPAEKLFILINFNENGTKKAQELNVST